MMVGMRGHVLAWAGGAVTVAVAAGLGVYFAVAGLDKADKLASVAGAFIGLAGLVASVYGMVQARRDAPGSSSAAGEGGQSVAGSTVARGVTQVSDVTGSVRIGDAPSSSPVAPAAPASPVPSSTSGRPLSGVVGAPGGGGGQSVTDSQVGGDVTQVDGVGGDVDVDR